MVFRFNGVVIEPIFDDGALTRYRVLSTRPSLRPLYFHIEWCHIPELAKVHEVIHHAIDRAIRNQEASVAGAWRSAYDG